MPVPPHIPRTPRRRQAGRECLAGLLLFGLAVTTPGLSGVAQAQAQPYPNRPIRLIVPYPPGGPLDLSARALAEGMRGALGTVVVENRTGAGGNIGADAVAKSPPDGHTVLLGAVATHAINPSLYPSMPYDAIRDFAPISLIAVVPNVLVLNKAFASRERIDSVSDLIALLRRRPGAYQFASGGNGSAGHLAGELFKQQSNTFAVHIPYRGAGPAQLDLMAGEVQFMFDNLASAAARIREGRLLALGVTTAERSSSMSELPTLAEASAGALKGFDISTWYGLLAPAGTPRPIIDQLNAALRAAMATERFRQTMVQQAAQAAPTSPEAFADLIQTESVKYRELVRRSGARVD